ncbi:PLD-like domain [Chelatococcus sambhunathii]|uniref:PLD-like domain n=1 Tax=Chelatococcus sambhunathii TaxID=363953 RepID=A0ABP2ADJ4_9HYPH|nr:phospholipase D family protein [Chelatococcus sambhunathii]CUA91261.1 PLD-like domain [Chelatococcus sambhunathii]
MAGAKTEFLSGKALHDAIAEIAKSERLYCAVAFWGDGADSLIGQFDGRDIKIICNLNHIGTNPRVIGKFPLEYVRRLDDLHAKVYIGDTHIVVTSANASRNGIDLGGIRGARWVEAGIRIPCERQIIDWFNGLWEESASISEKDIELAISLWDQESKKFPPPRLLDSVVYSASGGNRYPTRSAAFRFFGAVPRNVRWSWSARNEKDKILVITLWEDEVRNGDSVDITPGKYKRHGARELIGNLRWAKENCGGDVRVVWLKRADGGEGSARP